MLDFVLSHYKENALDTEKALRNVKRRLGATMLNWRMIAVAAASLVIVVGMAFWGRYNSTTTVVAYNQTREIHLPDGSLVFLAPGSELSFNHKGLSGKGIRKVSLDGKAIFDVEHVSSRPFEISSASGFVRVLGTQFQIDNLKHEVLVMNGKVFFSRSEADDGVILTDGMSARIIDDSLLPVIDELTTGNQIAWKRGTFIYNGQLLSIAIAELEEYYGRKIVVDAMGKDISETSIVGSFDVNSPDEVLAAISEAFDIRLSFR